MNNCLCSSVRICYLRRKIRERFWHLYIILSEFLWRVPHGAVNKVMEGNIFASTETVECPLCSQSFQPSVINRHVNNCLNITDSSSGSSNPGKKRKSSEGQGASPQKSAWGSLKPSKSVAGPSVKKAKTTSPKKSQSKKNVNHNYAQREDFDNNAENTPFVEKNRTKSNNIPVFGMPQRPDPSDSVGGVVPLAEKLRPLSLEDYVGQEKAVGKKSMLRNLMKSNDIPSMILWGPPGCGKVRIICFTSWFLERSQHEIHIAQLS